MQLAATHAPSSAPSSPPVTIHLPGEQDGQHRTDICRALASVDMPPPAPAGDTTESLGEAERTAREKAATFSETAHPVDSAPAGAIDTVRERMATATEKHQIAAKSGVDVARAGFLNRLLGLGMAAAGLAVAAAITAATLGAAAPLMAIVGVRFVVAAADAVYAYKVWQNPLKQPPEPAPPMGANAVNNFLYAVALAVSPGKTAQAKDVAARLGFVVTLGLAAAGVATAVVGPPPELIGNLCRQIATGISGVINFVDVKLADFRSRRDCESRDAVVAVCDAMSKLEQEDPQSYKALVDQFQMPLADEATRESVCEAVESATVELAQALAAPAQAVPAAGAARGIDASQLAVPLPDAVREQLVRHATDATAPAPVPTAPLTTASRLLQGLNNAASVLKAGISAAL